MGNWRIVIEGTGPHHGPPEQHAADAEKLAARFVAQLVESGHSIAAARFERIVPPPPDPRIEAIPLPADCRGLLDHAVGARLPVAAPPQEPASSAASWVMCQFCHYLMQEDGVCPKCFGGPPQDGGA